MADNRLEIQIALTGSVDKNSQKSIEAQAKKTGEKAGENFDKSFTNSASKGIASLSASIRTLGALAVGIKLIRTFSDGIDAAKRQEDAVNSLNTALQLTGKYTSATSTELQNYASSLQLVTKYGDEAILESQALIQSLGNLDKEGLKRATKATLDLASALNIDLRSAATLVGKAAAGEVGSFSRYGLTIKKAENNTATFANALTALEKKFGGTAEKKVNTFAGATDQLSNSFGDLLEGFGFFITKNPLIVTGLKDLTSVVASFGTALTKTASAFNSLFPKDKVTEIDKVNAKINDTGKAINFLTDKLKIQQGLEFGGKTESPMIKSIKKDLEAARTARKEFLKERALIRSKLKEIEESQLSDSQATDQKYLLSKEQLASQLQSIGLTQIQALQMQRDSQLEIIRQAEERGIEDKIGYDARRLELERVYNESLKAIQDEQTLNSQMSFQSIGDSLQILGERAKITSGQIAKALTNGIGNAAASGFAAFGSALAKGENAIDAFGKAFLQSIGGALIQEGSAWILTGTARSFAGDPSGSQLIAAGAAMATFGGVLSASGGGGAPSSGGGGASGAGYQSGSGSRDLASIEEPEIIAKEKTNVQLIVQGSIFNTSETARNLTDLLNDNFDSTGASLTNTRLA